MCCDGDLTVCGGGVLLHSHHSRVVPVFRPCSYSCSSPLLTPPFLAPAALASGHVNGSLRPIGSLHPIFFLSPAIHPAFQRHWQIPAASPGGRGAVVFWPEKSVDVDRVPSGQGTPASDEGRVKGCARCLRRPPPSFMLTGLPVPGVTATLRSSLWDIFEIFSQVELD